MAENGNPTFNNTEAKVHLQRLVVLYVLAGAPEQAGRTLRTYWSSDTPEVAEAAADVIEAAPQAFQHMTVTAASLRADQKEAEEAAEIKETIEKMLRWATARQADARARLYDNTQTAVGAITAAKESQLLSPELRAQVTVAAGDLDTLLTTRSEGIKETRRDLRALRAEADERVAEVSAELVATTQELSILRGQGEARAQPLAARSRRRSPRSRRT